MSFSLLAVIRYYYDILIRNIFTVLCPNKTHLTLNYKHSYHAIQFTKNYRGEFIWKEYDDEVETCLFPRCSILFIALSNLASNKGGWAQETTIRMLGKPLRLLDGLMYNIPWLFLEGRSGSQTSCIRNNKKTLKRSR